MSGSWTKFLPSARTRPVITQKRQHCWDNRLKKSTMSQRKSSSSHRENGNKSVSTGQITCGELEEDGRQLWEGGGLQGGRVRKERIIRERKRDRGDFFSSGENGGGRKEREERGIDKKRKGTDIVIEEHVGCVFTKPPSLWGG